jgi:hypothetical protein
MMFKIPFSDLLLKEYQHEKMAFKIFWIFNETNYLNRSSIFHLVFIIMSI